MDREIDAKHNQLRREIKEVKQIANDTLTEARRTNGKVRKVIIGLSIVGGMALAAVLGVDGALEALL